MSSAPSTPGTYRSPRTSNARKNPVREADTPPPPSFSSPATTRRLQHVAKTLSEGVSLQMAHPLEILHRLLDDIQQPSSRHHAKYGAFVSTEGENLVRLLERCIRKEVWELCSNNGQKASAGTRTYGLPTDIEALKALGGDTGYFGRAIYLHIVEFADGTTRLYVGQAYNLAARINHQHLDFRYRRDHPSLHNFAVDRSVNDTYVVLAQLRENTQTDLVLNLLEQWMTLCFQTLTDEALEAWLGPLQTASRCNGTFGKLRSRKVFGLNVASPLDQGDREASINAFQMLKGSRDDMAKEYFWDVKRRPRPVVQAVIKEDGLTWTQYLPQFLAVVALGFVAGRWSAVIGKKY